MRVRNFFYFPIYISTRLPGDKLIMVTSDDFWKILANQIIIWSRQNVIEKRSIILMLTLMGCDVRGDKYDTHEIIIK
jgi:hypothetical protein